MNRYVVSIYYRQKDGSLGTVEDFSYIKGIENVRRRIGNLGRAKRGGAYGTSVIYEGENSRMKFRVVNGGRWE